MIRNLLSFSERSILPQAFEAQENKRMWTGISIFSRLLCTMRYHEIFLHIHPPPFSFLYIPFVFVQRRPHEVSQEVMIYFRELTEACVGANENRRHEALDNATLDPGLQPILPHLVTFITEGVRFLISIPP